LDIDIEAKVSEGKHSTPNLHVHLSQPFMRRQRCKLDRGGGPFSEAFDRAAPRTPANSSQIVDVSIFSNF
jgi:hypothetical protein